MKLDINNPQHAEILARYLSGEMDSHEKSEFEGFLEVEPENLQIVAEMEKIWNSSQSRNNQRPPETHKAWNRLHQRLSEDRLIPSGNSTAGRKTTQPWFRIAAALAILLAIGTLIVVTQLPGKHETEMLSVTNTDPGKTMILTLADGSIIYLAPSASFAYQKKFQSVSRNVELKGEAFFDIQRDPGRPFTIQTVKALVEVLGTSFNLKSEDGAQLELKVTSGKVKVTSGNTSDLSELVVAGEKLVLNGNSVTKSQMGPAEASRWFTRRMHFRDESLDNILKVLNRNFSTSFFPGNKKVAGRKLTVTFEEETVETMTELICLSLNLKSQVRNDSIILIPANPGE